MKIANRNGFKFGEQAYLIENEFGLVCVSYASCEQDALDHAVDAGFLDSQIMSEEDHKEYESEGWHDSFTFAGNEGKPVWSTYLRITEADDRKRIASNTINPSNRG